MGVASGSSIFERLRPLVNSSFDGIRTGGSQFLKPLDFEHQLITDTIAQETRPQIAMKTIVRPDRIAVSWVHYPAGCFGHPLGRCNLEANHYPVSYAHIREHLSATNTSE